MPCRDSRIVLASADRRHPARAGGLRRTPGPTTASNPAPQAGADQAKATEKPGELTTPDRRIDTGKVDPVVKGEVEGGESEAPDPDRLPLHRGDRPTKAIHDEPYEIAVPTGLPPVASVIPASNPMTKGKVELGKQLYFDPRVSLDGTVSCATCHDPAKGWTDNAEDLGRHQAARSAAGTPRRC